MPIANDLLVFPERLNEAGIDYMVTGAMAAILYSEPRTTYDIDMVLALNSHQAEQLQTIFTEEEFYCPPLDVIRIEMSRDLHGHFNIIHHASGLKADIYPLNKDPLHHWAFAQKRSYEINNFTLWIAPPEYVILRKLQYYQEGGSEKHLKDIRGMLVISAKLIDRASLEKKIMEYHLETLWQKVDRAEL